MCWAADQVQAEAGEGRQVAFLVVAFLDLQDLAFLYSVRACCLQVLLVEACRDRQAFPVVASLAAYFDCQEASSRPCWASHRDRRPLTCEERVPRMTCSHWTSCPGWEVLQAGRVDRAGVSSNWEACWSTGDRDQSQAFRSQAGSPRLMRAGAVCS